MNGFPRAKGVIPSMGGATVPLLGAEGVIPSIRVATIWLNATSIATRNPWPPSARLMAQVSAGISTHSVEMVRASRAEVIT